MFVFVSFCGAAASRAEIQNTPWPRALTHGKDACVTGRKGGSVGRWWCVGALQNDQTNAVPARIKVLAVQGLSTRAGLKFGLCRIVSGT